MSKDDNDTVEILPVPVKPKRGFAAMSPEKRAEISARGAKRLHELGLNHKYSSEEAKTNGRIGGLNRGKGQE